MNDCQVLIWLAVIITTGFITGLFLLAHHLLKD